MRYVSRVLPRPVREIARRIIDSPYCTPVESKETLGTLDRWTVVMNRLSPDSVIYSGGVGESITFEQDLIRRIGPTIHIFDPSPVARAAIATANLAKLRFKPLGLVGGQSGGFAVSDGQGSTESWKMGQPGRDASTTTLRREMELNGHDSIDLLKIDIEGFEYGVLEECMDIPITQICVEFHDWMPEISRHKTAAAIETLRCRGYRLIHRYRHDHTFLWPG